MASLIDLLFPAVGTRLPTDHGYPLYSSISRLLPCLHDGSVPFALLPITGQHVGNGLIALDSSRSRLRLRLAVADLPRVLPLAGKTLNLLGHRLTLGVPQVFPIRPAANLQARSVTFKNSTEPEPFLSRAKIELDRLGIRGRLQMPWHINREGRFEPHRHVLRVKDSRVVCFPLRVEGLSPEDSLRLQEVGLGGRRHMGGGVFVPFDAEDGHDD
jgi:CRISPR-associated protein Cas6